MEVTEYSPPVVEPYVVRAIRFEPWPFVDAYIALNPRVVTRRVAADGRLTRQAFGAWSLGPGNLLAELSNGETVHALTQAALDAYLNRTGTP